MFHTFKPNNHCLATTYSRDRACAVSCLSSTHPLISLRLRLISHSLQYIRNVHSQPTSCMHAAQRALLKIHTTDTPTRECTIFARIPKPVQTLLLREISHYPFTHTHSLLLTSRDRHSTDIQTDQHTSHTNASECGVAMAC